MGLRLRAFPSLFLLLLMACFAFADNVSLSVSASRRKIYLGETFNLTIAVEGSDDPREQPDLSRMQEAAIQLLGSHSNSRSTMTIINGKVSRTSSHGRIFAYAVTPRKAGLFSANPIRFIHRGKKLHVEGPTVQVMGLEKQDRVVVSIRASANPVLVEEPFTIQLSVAVKELPGDIAKEIEPVDPRILPHLSADFLEIRPPTQGLKEPDINQALSALIDRSRGEPCFSINNYVSQNVGFDSFLGGGDPFQKRPLRFRLPSKRIRLNGKHYREYTLPLEYVPTKEGEFTFGPATFKGTILTGVSDARVEHGDVYTIGPAVTVRVVPPPEENRPATFIGSVGRGMHASASLDTSICKVGDPLSLTLEVTGPISISNMRTPLLSIQPALTRDFRIYDDSVSADTLPNGKRFKYRVRPLREGTLEFPPIELSYYNTTNRVYETIHTQPLPVQAQATAQVVTDEENDDPEKVSGLEQAVKPETLISGIIISPSGARSGSLLPSEGMIWTLLLAGPLLCLVLVLFSPIRHLAVKIRTLTRQSGAVGKALRSLRRASTPAAASQAVRDYLSSRIGLSGIALTPEEAARLLQGRDVPQERIAVFQAALAQLDEAQYRPDASDSLLHAAVAVLERELPQIDPLLTSSAAEKGKRHYLSVLLIGLLVFPVFASAPGARDATRQFLWEQANAQISSARESADFAAAARTYNRLISDGVRNGPLFLNLGTAWLMAGDAPNAIAALNRAERYMGETPETRQGLIAAYALRADKARVELPWSRTAFFWHYTFPSSIRVIAALGGWMLLWLGIFLRVLYRKTKKQILRTGAEAAWVAGGLALIIFGASVAVTWTQERHDDATWMLRSEK